MMDSEYILYRKGGIDGKLRGYKHKEQKHTFTTCSPMFAKGVIKGAELTQRLQRHFCMLEEATEIGPRFALELYKLK